MKLFSRETMVPKEHAEMYKKQADLFYSFVKKYRERSGIQNIISIVGNKILRIEIELYEKKEAHIVLYPKKSLSRKELLSPDETWLKEQYERYVKEIFENKAIWTIGTSYEVKF